MLEVLASALRQEREIKDIQIRKEEKKKPTYFAYLHMACLCVVLVYVAVTKMPENG